jgi:hypothetical protein
LLALLECPPSLFGAEEKLPFSLMAIRLLWLLVICKISSGFLQELRVNSQELHQFRLIELGALPVPLSLGSTALTISNCQGYAV